MVLPRSRSSSRMRISRPGVAAVQPDGRLVQHVARAHQPRAQAGGQLDALRFAAGERGREAVERQVLQPDVVQELQPLADLDQDLVGDGGLFRRQLERVEERLRLGDVHAHDLGQVLAAHAHVQRFLAQPRAVALRAAARSRGSGSGRRARAACTSWFPGSRRSARMNVARPSRAPPSSRSQNGTCKRTLPLRAPCLKFPSHERYLRLGPRLHRALVERQRLVGNHAVHVEIDGVAEALAARAGARPGELKLNRIGSGSANSIPQVLHWNFSLKRSAFAARGALENHFAGFAIADFDGVDQALVQIRRDRDAVHQHEQRLREIDVQQRFRASRIRTCAPA